MRYLSVCSGIEAATVAWHPLGWSPLAFSEIEAFPRAVLKHHWPEVPLHGDFTTIEAADYGRPDLLVGGTPCQSFSVAGLRGGMADERGNLALEYLRLAGRIGARWLVWENVPGVLSSNGGRDFGSFLGGLAQLGYGFAYRVLDAQFFGVPQRRRRVFVVGYLGDWRRAAAVLFERHSLQGHPPPRREAGERVARRTGHCAEVSSTLNAHFGDKMGLENQHVDQGCPMFVTHTLRGEGFNASEDGTGRGTPLVPVAFGWQNSSSQGDSVSEHVTPSLDKSKTPAVAYDDLRRFNGPHGGLSHGPVHPTLESTNPKHFAQVGTAVRRLLPTECEALQGFPRNYTLVPYRGKPAADGPRYKALGNSMAVPCMRWIGERIACADNL